MAAVSGSYGSLLQGMSQQPAQSRGEGQCELQVNMVSDPVSDLSKRPATLFKGDFPNATANTFFHHYQRGDGEDYIFAIDNGTISVRDLDGNIYPVVGSTSYLNTSRLPKDSFDATTIGDLTIITNQTKTISYTSANSTTGNVVQSTLEIKGATWATTYTVKIEQANGTKHTVEIQTPSGVGDATKTPIDPNLDREQLKLANIAIQLRDAINAKVANLASIPSGVDNMVVINTSLGTLTSVEDGRNNSFLVHINRTTDNPNKLPATSLHNRVVKIEPTGTESSADYYMRFVSETGSNYGEGKWTEYCVINPLASEDEDIDFKTTLDATTMPHGIIRLQDSNGVFFRFSPLDGTVVTDILGDDYNFPEWGKRLIGDTKSNPDPSFVGKQIQTVGLFQERMYFLSDEAVVFSASDDYFTYFYATALQVLDKDPIDFTASTNEVNRLLHGVIHDRDLVLFSENAQFVISGDQPLVPSTAFMTPITFFTAAPKAKPVQSGRSIYFPIIYGRFTGVRELQTDEISATRDAPPISAHVSRLIEGEAVKLSNSNEVGTLCVSTDLYDNRLYYYEYLWSGNERVQSSWSFWEFNNDFQVLYHFFVKTELYIVLKNKATGVVSLLSSQIEDFVNTGFEFNLYLDFLRKLPTVRVQDPNDPLKMVSQVTIDRGFSEYVIVQSENCPYPGLVATIYNEDNYTNDPITITFTKDFGEGAEVFVGIPFKAEFVPTRPFVKDNKDVAITSGNLIVSRYLLTYRNSGFIESVVENRFGEDEVNGKMTGRVVGAKNNVVGQSPVTSGTAKIAVLAAPETAKFSLISNDYRPMTLIDLEWEGQFSYNKRRL